MELDKVKLVINSLILQLVKRFAEEISEEFSIPLDQVERVFERAYHPCVDRCVYTTKTTGNICGKKTSSKEYKYCLKHLAERKRLSLEPLEKEDDKPQKVQKLQKIQIFRNKYGHYIHEESKLVLKSSREKVITWREGEDGKLYPLTEKDIQLCKKYGFKYSN